MNSECSVNVLCYVIHPVLRGVGTPGDGRYVLQIGFGTSLFWAHLLFIFTLFFLSSSFVSLSSFSVFMSPFILPVPMRKCLRKHSCMSSIFI